MMGRRINGYAAVLTAWTIVIAVFAHSAPASAQQATAARLAETSTGEVGQRKESRQSTLGSSHQRRISNRIVNRVESRIQNRVDRFYDPPATSTSSFSQAEERTKTSSRP